MAKRKKASAKKAAGASAGVKKTAKKKSGQAAVNKKAPAKKKGGTTKKKASGRELIDTGRDKRFVRRDDQGQFQESDDVGRSLAQDRRTKAKSQVKSGQGDRGDR